MPIAFEPSKFKTTKITSRGYNRPKRLETNSSIKFEALNKFYLFLEHLAQELACVLTLNDREDVLVLMKIQIESQHAR
jgi:hypothetical protein